MDFAENVSLDFRENGLDKPHENFADSFANWVLGSISEDNDGPTIKIFMDSNMSMWMLYAIGN